jgi:glucose/arabinose dehydrogenase
MQAKLARIVCSVVTGMMTFSASALENVEFRHVFQSLSFNQPVFITHSPDDSDRLFVVEQSGTIKVFSNQPDVKDASIFLDIREGTHNDFLEGGEQGLLGLAFDPKYAENGYLYVNYTASRPKRTVVSRFQVDSDDPTLVNHSSELVLIEVKQDYSNHNGGMIAFGPDDHLYIGMGDGGSGGDPKNRAQDGQSLLGKMLRITRDGKIPRDNPFVGTPSIRNEIWAIGLRNPWRFSFDRANGKLWLADVGQNKMEEVDLITKGGNYGWRWYEGSREYDKGTLKPEPDFVKPIFEYGRKDGKSITGGYVYRGQQFPKMTGWYFLGDFVSGNMWALSSQDYSSVRLPRLSNPSGFGEDKGGELFVLSYSGQIFQVTLQ